MTDSTTAKGWMRKTNFTKQGDDDIQTEARVNAAWHHTRLFMDNGGGSLERKTMSRMLYLGIGTAVKMNSPKTFALTSPNRCRHISRYYHSPLRSAHGWFSRCSNCLWMCYYGSNTQWWVSSLEEVGAILQICQMQWHSHGWPHQTKANSHAWRICHGCQNQQIFWGRSTKLWLKAQSEIPSHMWYRPFGRRDNQIPLRTQTMNLASFYQDSSVPNKTMTPSNSKKGPSLFCPWWTSKVTGDRTWSVYCAANYWRSLFCLSLLWVLYLRSPEGKWSIWISCACNTCCMWAGGTFFQLCCCVSFLVSGGK